VNDLPYGIGCPSCHAWLVVSDEDPDASVSDLHDHIYWTHAPSDPVKTNQLLAKAVELTEAEAAKR
jgi:hypothetical protein